MKKRGRNGSKKISIDERSNERLLEDTRKSLLKGEILHQGDCSLGSGRLKFQKLERKSKAIPAQTAPNISQTPRKEIGRCDSNGISKKERAQCSLLYENQINIGKTLRQNRFLLSTQKKHASRQNEVRGQVGLPRRKKRKATTNKFTPSFRGKKATHDQGWENEQQIRT